MITGKKSWQVICFSEHTCKTIRSKVSAWKLVLISFISCMVHVWSWSILTVSVHWLVGPLVSLLVGPLVGRSVTHFFWRFPGSFCITTPAQSQATDSAVYMVLLYHECAQPNRNSLRTVERLTAWIMKTAQNSDFLTSLDK